MYYDDINCLPDSVKAALDEKGQGIWMKAFNSTVKKAKSKKSYRDAVFDAWMVLKAYPKCRYFAGFASTEDLDRQNDVVLAESGYKKIAKHIERGGTIIDTHTNRTVGSFFYANLQKSRTGSTGVGVYGVVYQGEPFYDEAWEKIKKAQDCPTCKDVRKGMSIGGFALDTRQVCDGGGCHRDIVDMSIHEISICQEPANPEALILEVNMMAKSVEDAEEKANEIRKDMREDIMDSSAPSPMDQAQAQGPAAEMDMPGTIKALREKLKEQQKIDKEMEALISDWQKGKSPEPKEQEKSVGVSKSACNLNTNEHTPADAKECPMDKKVYGDIGDQAKTEFLENKEIEADKSAKDHSKDDLFPGKPDAEYKEIGFKDGPSGPHVEIKIMPGFSGLKPSNKAQETVQVPDIKIPFEHLEEDEEEEDDIIEAAEEMKEEDEKALGKAEDGHMDSKEVKSKYGPEEKKKTVSDKGGEKEDNSIKGKSEVIPNGNKMAETKKGCGCGAPEGHGNMMDSMGGKIEIPAELKPLFDQFLREHGIKSGPEVKSAVIEEVVEKKLLVDEAISMEKLQQLSKAETFDTAKAMGQLAVIRLKEQNIMTKMKLARPLKTVDIQYLL